MYGFFLLIWTYEVQLLLDGTLTLVGLDEISLVGDVALPVYPVALDMLGF